MFLLMVGLFNLVKTYCIYNRRYSEVEHGLFYGSSEVESLPAHNVLVLD